MNQPLDKTIVSLPSDQDSSGRNLGEEEIAMLGEVIRSGTLTSTKGRFVRTFEGEFAKLITADHVSACASGSAAIHAAIAAINPEPGDEIITSAITDMGALTPILYQSAIPRFADVDERTCNVTAQTIERCLSKRTKAVIVTHLFGNPCDMNGIMELARSHNLPVIEDCAQAFLAQHDGRFVGTIGDLGCFSMQQGKHLTTGEGGLVITNDAALARRVFLFINKAWGYGDSQPDHYFLALNYRLTELQGAVALAQLSKLQQVIRNRIWAADLLTEQLKDIAGIETPAVASRSVHTYWKYCLRIDSSLISGGALAMAKLLKEMGISSAPRYIQKPAFMCQIFQKQQTFGTSNYPFNLASSEALNYDRSLFEGTFSALEGILVLPWNEHYTAQHVDYIADSIKSAAAELLHPEIN